MLQLCSVREYEHLLLNEGKPKGDALAKPFGKSCFLTLCLVAHHEEASVRARFLDLVFEGLKVRSLRFCVWAPLLALSATGDKTRAAKWKLMIGSLADMQRRFVWQKQRMLRGQGGTPQEAQSLTTGLPEYALMYLLYFLSYHPVSANQPEDLHVFLRPYSSRTHTHTKHTLSTH